MTSKDQSSGSGGLHPYWLVALTLAVCLGCPAYIAYRNWADPRAEAGMTAAAGSYLDALRDGDPAAAYGWVCGRHQRRFPLRRWLTTRTFPDIESYRIIDAKVKRSSRTSTYAVRAEIHYADGRVRSWRYHMSDERAGWRVCGESLIDSSG